MHKYRQWRDGKHGLAPGISAKPATGPCPAVLCMAGSEDSSLAADGIGYPRATGRTLVLSRARGLQSFQLLLLGPARILFLAVRCLVKNGPHTVR